ncbi:MAG: glycosyltransferase [Egibacteraceae bacterium]
MSSGPSVLHVITDTDRRGAQIFAYELVRALSAQGVEGRIVALEPGRSGSRLPVPTLGDPWSSPSTLRALRRAITASGAVVGHGSSTLPACAMAGLFTGVPFIYRNIGDPRYWVNTVARRLRVRLLLRRPGTVVALWTGTATALACDLGVPVNRIRIIPRGVSADTFPPVGKAERRAARQRFGLDADCSVLLALGALSAEKDLGCAIRAVGLLGSCQLLVAGDGPERQTLEHEASVHASGRVKFAGVVADAAEAIAAADAIVLSSRSEGLPGVLIEAGLRGVPAAAAAVGGVREIVEDHASGRVATPGDHVALSAAIRDVLDHRAAYGEAARRRCRERFEMGAVSAQWAELLTAILQTACGGGKVRW